LEGILIGLCIKLVSLKQREKIRDAIWMVLQTLVAGSESIWLGFLTEFVQAGET
jgi:hypothetical protein